MRVESDNVNKKLLHFLLPVLFNTDKSADRTKFKNQPINSESLLGEQNEGQVWTHHALKPDRKSTRLNSSHVKRSRMPSSA